MEGTTATDYCLQILTPHIESDFEKHKRSAE
jgi:hypothetical protein